MVGERGVGPGEKCAGWEARPYRYSLRLFTIVKSSCGPIASWILAHVLSLLLVSCFSRANFATSSTVVFPQQFFCHKELLHQLPGGSLWGPLLATVKRWKLTLFGHVMRHKRLSKPSFRASWRVSNTMVGTGNAGGTAPKKGHCYQCRSCS